MAAIQMLQYSSAILNGVQCSNAPMLQGCPILQCPNAPKQYSSRETYLNVLVKMAMLIMIIIRMKAKMSFDDEDGQYPPPARKERFVNNIDTSTHKVSKLNINFRICELRSNMIFSQIKVIFGAFMVLILKLKLCVLNAFVKWFWTVWTIDSEQCHPIYMKPILIACSITSAFRYSDDLPIDSLTEIFPYKMLGDL